MFELNRRLRRSSLLIMCMQGDMDITAGTRFHTGGWSADGGWGTVMRTNLDDECDIVSYDVFMDNGTRLETVPVTEVEADVKHGRALKAEETNKEKVSRVQRG